MGMYQSIEFSNFKGAYLASYESRFDGDYASKIANIYSGVTGEDAILATVGGIRAMSEWKGDRKTHSPGGYKQTITNRVFENNVTIPVESYKRSGSELWEPKVREIGQQAADHWQDLCVEVLTSSATNGFDGLTLFSASHTGGSNLLTSSDVASLGDVSTAAAPTADEMATVLVDVMFKMMTLKNEHDLYVNKGAKGFMLLASNPKVVASAKRAIQANQLSQGATSAVRGLIEGDGFQIDAVLEPGLGAADSAVFYLARTDAESKGIILLDEFPIEFQELGEGTEYAKLKNSYFFGVKAVRGAGFGAWQRIVKCTLS